MGRFVEFLSRLLPVRTVHSEAEAERLRLAFSARYHAFRLLLDANNKALEIMAEIERTLDGTRPFGMAFVRARCTRIATHVMQMVRKLRELAPERYAQLNERFRAIQAEIDDSIVAPGQAGRPEYVLSLDELAVADAADVGGKMANLGEMRNRLDLNVPAGFVVTMAGYRRFMEHNELQVEIDGKLQVVGAGDGTRLFQASSEIRQLIVGAPLPLDLQEAILGAYRELEELFGVDVAVAVRSSALGEDDAGSNAAGQYQSMLNVTGESLLASYREVIASKYAPPAMAYRLHRGLHDEDVAMCVGVLRMIDGSAGGVLYTRSPLDAADDAVIVHSAWGLPMPVVEGRVPVDEFEVERETPLRIRRREIRDKPLRYVCHPGEGLRREENPEPVRLQPSLSDDQILELTRRGLSLEQHYGTPRDVEWTVQPDGAIVLLQTRELQMPAAADSAAADSAAADSAVDNVAADSVDDEPGGEVLLRGGTTASRGAAAGPVHIVEKEADALRFPEGAVLVTVQPLPRWAGLLGSAAAIVAEHGSVVGHLASVAREFRVPALFGLSTATTTLSRGEVVTVDATRGEVLAGRLDSRLAAPPPPASPVQGSPVFEALRSAARHITPLNLLDPDAPAFKAENCRTLHDITRFCHEKAVREVFRFGKEHRFPERSSKQLYCDVPMQWWVLNLDDGFRQEVEGRYVRLDNIASGPMLALWDGITAVPWEGPPPMDGKGFMSVMFGATTNPALATGLPSRYADRNYFMISRDYCLLQSRLGAHFAIVEALVSERTADNFVAFQFKGGAADFDRRLKRVVFVKEILERYGFRVELNEDNLIARIEGRETEFMTGRLKILGHLAIHTRQLDMVMARPAAVEHYRNKILGEVESILAG